VKTLYIDMATEATYLRRDSFRLSRSWWACRTMNNSLRQAQAER